MRSLLRVAVATVVTAGALTAVAVPATAASPYKVTVKLAQSEITIGQTVNISGRVTGGAVKNKTVTLYTKSAVLDDAWKKIGTSKLSTSGYYKKSYKPKDPGPTLFRVIKPAGSGHGAGKGYSGGALDVYEWRDLSAYKATATFGDASLNGDPYRGALLVKEGTGASFDTTDAQCTRFRGILGVDGGSPDAYGTVTLADAFLSFFASFTVGRSTAGRSVSIALDPEFGLTFFADFPNNNASNTFLVLDGQLYCNSPSPY